MFLKDLVQAKEEFGFKLELNHKLVANYRASLGQGIENLSVQWMTKILETRNLDLRYSFQYLALYSIKVYIAFYAMIETDMNFYRN